MLNSSRAVQGIGAAIMFAVSLALLSQAFPSAQERAKAFAAYGASIGAAFAVGPLVGGALTSGLDWRWIFLVNLPLGLLCLAITRRSVEESQGPRRPQARRARPAHADRRPVPARARAAARQRGRLDERGDRRRARPAPSSSSARSSPSRRASRSRCSRSGCSATAPSPARRSRRSPSPRRSSPCSSTRRSTCSRSSGCRRSRPASSTCPAR